MTDEELNNHLDALDKKHSDFVQKWLKKQDKNELDEYTSNMTKEEKDEFMAYLIWILVF